MLHPFSVVIADHDPNWSRLAALHADRLEILGDVLLAVHHIGSTSVPGLAAKPILDLMPVVAAISILDQRRAMLEGLGYSWHGEYGLAGRRYCTMQDGAGARIVQAHFFERGDPAITRHLAFRDYLRRYPDAAQAYEVEKRRAQALFPHDSHAYTDEKSAWITRIEAQALAWAARATNLKGPAT